LTFDFLLSKINNFVWAAGGNKRAPLYHLNLEKSVRHKEIRELNSQQKMLLLWGDASVRAHAPK
jgi:hypothetical protein